MPPPTIVYTNNIPARFYGYKVYSYLYLYYSPVKPDTVWQISPSSPHHSGYSN